MSKIFERSDIVLTSLNPVAGKELQGSYRPCLVLSKKEFNKLGLTLIAPITQGEIVARFRGFSTSLIGSGTETQGVVLASSIRMLDLTARKSKFVEKAPEFITNDVLARLSTIIN